jgi:hypothetical protein
VLNKLLSAGRRSRKHLYIEHLLPPTRGTLT